MTKRYTLAIDCDLILAQSDVLWLNWLKSMTMANPVAHGLECHSIEHIQRAERPYGGLVDYNLTKYFPEVYNKRVTPFDFWKNTGAYDTCSPVRGAREALVELHKHGFEFVVTTHNKGNGSRSKYNFLERLFKDIPFDYVVTKEKHRVDADAIIDDRNEFLNQFLNKGKLAVKLSTPYTQNVEIDTKGMDYNFVECKDWFEIKNAILSSFPF